MEKYRKQHSANSKQDIVTDVKPNVTVTATVHKCFISIKVFNLSKKIKWHIKQNSKQYFIKETKWDREIQKELRVFARRMETVRADQQLGHTVSGTRPNKEYKCFREEHFIKVTHNKEGWQFRVSRQQKTANHMGNNHLWERQTLVRQAPQAERRQKINDLCSRLDFPAVRCCICARENGSASSKFSSVRFGSIAGPGRWLINSN